VTLSLIVAMTDEGVIGSNNKLPWHLSEDLKRFKQLTMGHPIIMGRKTFESIGRPLPGRQNIVVTRNSQFRAEGITTAEGICEAMAKAEQNSGEIFVIGGAGLFEAAVPLADKVYLTRIHKNFPGDVFFPKVGLEDSFEVVEQSEHQSPPPDSFAFSFITMKKS